MIEASKLPESLSTLYAGDLIKSWVFCCWKCLGWGIDIAASGNTLKRDAAARARAAGWSKTIAGWICPACQQKETGAPHE